MVKILTSFGKKAIRIGIIGDQAGADKEGSGESSAATLGEIASYHEFGLGTNPERSFVRAWFDDNKAEAVRDIRKMAEQIALLRIKKDQGLGLLGAKWVGQMQKLISSHIDPPLEDATVDRKKATGMGGETPLIATGQLRSSITWDVVES